MKTYRVTFLVTSTRGVNPVRKLSGWLLSIAKDWSTCEDTLKGTQVLGVKEETISPGRGNRPS